MSATPAIAYVGGLFLFGFMWWLFNGIKGYFEPLTQNTDVVTLLNYFWLGIILIYLIFGGIWLARTYNERQYMEM